MRGASQRFARGSDAGSSRENSYTPSPGASTTARLGRLDQRDFERQTGAASCLLLILAAIIYWQIREIDRVLSEAGSDGRTISTSSYCPISAAGSTGQRNTRTKPFS